MDSKTFQAPDVTVVPNGHDGYIVRMTDVDRTQIDLAKFVPMADAATHREAMATARKQARAYRDGVAEGIFRSAFMLNRIIGVGV